MRDNGDVMETIAKADIFFVITAGAVVAVTILLLVILIYVLRILNNVEHISDRVRQETEIITNDIDNLRQEGLGLRRILRIFGISGRRKKGRIHH